MKARHWSLAIVLILINYIIFAGLFSRLLDTDFSAAYATRTPVPTFTPAPAQPLVIVPTPIPITPIPSPTATRVIVENASTTGDAVTNATLQVAAALPDEALPELVAPGIVNIRSGPGLNYPVIGSLNANTTMPVIGRNLDASWWQIKIPDNASGWVSGAVVSINGAEQVPVIEASVPASTAAEPAASKEPAKTTTQQYEPYGWTSQGGANITRFFGKITDSNGNPVNGTFVQASCGSYSTISYPSGPTGWGADTTSSNWPPGFYDLIVDNKPVPCLWTLTIVDTNDRTTVKATLSNAVPVEITADKSIVTANWQKN